MENIINAYRNYMNAKDEYTRAEANVKALREKYLPSDPLACLNVEDELPEVLAQAEHRFNKAWEAYNTARKELSLLGEFIAE